MVIQSLLRDVARRYQESTKKQKKPQIKKSLIDEVGTRFQSFINEQSKEDKPLHEITRTIKDLPLVTQREIDEVGTRFHSFIADRQKGIDDVGKRFEDFKVKAKQFSKDYDPYSFDERAPINNIPVLGEVRKFSRDYLWTDEQKEGLELQRRMSSGEKLTPEEREKAMKYSEQQAMDMAMNSVMPMGSVKTAGANIGEKLLPKVLTKAQQIAKDKLPNIMYDFDFKGAQKIADTAKGASDDWINAFRSWVNTRASKEITSLKVSSQFKEFDKEGLNGIFRFQAGDRTGRMADVQQFFDNRFKELKKAGVTLGYKKDYLPQLWMQTGEEVEEALGRTLTSKPSFSLKSIIRDYQEGINLRTDQYPNGLTPRFTKLSDLIGWYEKTTSKVLADQKFFNYLKKAKLIRPEDTAPEWWKPIDAERFPKLTVKVGGEFKQISYRAEGRLADAINNYLVDPEGSLVKFANFATIAKNLGLSAGVAIPYPKIAGGKLSGAVHRTAINAHGFNIFVRSALASNNPLTAIFRTSNWLMRPKVAEQFVMKNLDDAEKFVKNGLTLSVENYDLQQDITSNLLGNPVKRKVGQTLTMFENLFGDPTFKQAIPAIKIQYTRALYDDLIKTLPEEKAIRYAVESANDVFGGINLADLMRNKNTQTKLRAVFLAPDWAESTIRTGAGIVKGLANPLSPEYKAYRVFARNFVFSYILANVVNKALSGHWMFENEGNNKFNIDTGTYTGDGKKRYFKIYGTGADMFRIPYEVISGLLKGDPSATHRAVANRLSLPAGSIYHLASNQDYLGRNIYGSDKWGNDIPVDQQIGGVTNEVLRGVGVPTQIMAGVDMATGKSNFEQAMVQSLEAPIRYQGGANTDTQKRKMAMLQSLGFEGEELANEMERTKHFRWSGNQGDEKSLVDHIVDKFKGLFGKEEPNTPEPTDPLMKAFQADIEKDETATRIREIFKFGYSKEWVEEKLQEEGLGTYEEAELIIMKALGVENGTRGAYIQELTKGLDDEDKEATLYYLAENKVLTTSVITQWLDSGEITEEEADYYKDLIKATKGSSTASKGKGKGSSKKVTAGSIPTIKIPTFAGKTTKSGGQVHYKQLPQVQFNSSLATPRKQRISAPKPEIKFESYT